MNYYELLQVTPSASAEVIKTAYKALAKKYHPDLYQGNRSFAEEKMKLLNEAISILENDEKRRDYNIENNFPDVSYGAESNAAYMKNIDDFLNFSDSDKDSSDKNEPADITEIMSFQKYRTDIFDDSKPLFDYEEEMVKVTSRKKNKTPVGKWYYIAVAGLVIANIIIVCLIISNFSTTLLDGLRQKNEPESGGTVTDGHDEAEDYIEPEDWDDDVIPANGSADITATEDFIETDNTPTPSEPEPSDENAAITLPPTAATTGKKLPAPTTAKSVQQKTTQPPTVPVTESKPELPAEDPAAEDVPSEIELPYQDEFTGDTTPETQTEESGGGDLTSDTEYNEENQTSSDESES